MLSTTINTAPSLIFLLAFFFSSQFLASLIFLHFYFSGKEYLKVQFLSVQRDFSAHEHRC